MKIALCQINTITGNVRYNLHRILTELENAAANGARLAIFPELCIPGYPPKDLLEYRWFIEEAADALSRIQSQCRALGIDCICGTVHTNIFGGKKELLNAAAFVRSTGDIQFTFKKLLPTYDVFDETRYFEPCPSDCRSPIFSYAENNIRIGVSICEDIWNDNQFWKNERLYEFDPIESLVQQGANVIVNISASPFVVGKPIKRLEMLRHTSRRWDVTVVLVNQVGGCDQIIFDGGSAVVLADGSVPAAAGWFTEKTVVWDVERRDPLPEFARMTQTVADDVQAIHDALSLGLSDYLKKTGFQQVVVGNSGGIDSATVLTLATEVLGPNAILSISMPGPFTSEATRRDSSEVARRLGIKHFEIPITEPFEVLRRILEDPAGTLMRELFAGDSKKIDKLANENLQARLRGNILMWISNAISRTRTLVLSTGNKSELAAGYCTLYGDMAGGLAVISDVPKTMVYKLARFLNSRMGNPIPQSILEREPTAELAPNQKDTDTLPPYPVLDEIIRLYIEEFLSPEQIAELGVADAQLVRKTIAMIDRAEYKRAQAAPGLKVTSKAFGFGRRMPITRGF
ncbi:MAG: NAD+ synthase [Candidatus Sumerlaeaceae bacterium]|nr:NAD+ synthase [Candidatus Sumerlaeaceae bacterium]